MHLCKGYHLFVFSVCVWVQFYNCGQNNGMLMPIIRHSYDLNRSVNTAELSAMLSKYIWILTEKKVVLVDKKLNTSASITKFLMKAK